MPTDVISLQKQDFCVYQTAGNQLYTQGTFTKPALVFRNHNPGHSMKGKWS